MDTCFRFFIRPFMIFLIFIRKESKKWKKSIPTYYRVIQMDLLKIDEGKYDLVMNYESRSKVIHETHFFQSRSVSVAKFEMSKQWVSTNFQLAYWQGCSPKLIEFQTDLVNSFIHSQCCSWVEEKVDSQVNCFEKKSLVYMPNHH